MSGISDTAWRRGRGDSPDHALAGREHHPLQAGERTIGDAMQAPKEAVVSDSITLHVSRYRPEQDDEPGSGPTTFPTTTTRRCSRR